MGHVLYNRLAFGVSTVLIIGVVSTWATAKQRDDEQHKIYYSSQKAADKALVQFDSDNPDCQLWTNWQKLCSRTGTDGETVCRKTQRKQIKPSIPFCVAKIGIGAVQIPTNAPVGLIDSSLRFCTYPHGEPTNLRSKIEACVYSDERPFNGLNLNDREHNWCRHWNEVGTGQAASKYRTAKKGMFCADRFIPEWCAWADGMGYGPQKGEAPENDTIGVAVNHNSSPVHGAFCRRKGKF